MSGEELEGVSVEEVALLKSGYSIDLIDEHLAIGETHDIAMDLHTDRYCCVACDVWIEPPCNCSDACPYTDSPVKPSLSGVKDKIDTHALESMRKRKNRTP